MPFCTDCWRQRSYRGDPTQKFQTANELWVELKCTLIARRCANNLTIETSCLGQHCKQLPWFVDGRKRSLMSTWHNASPEKVFRMLAWMWGLPSVAGLKHVPVPTALDNQMPAHAACFQGKNTLVQKGSLHVENIFVLLLCNG